jgi:hypothetical protein
MAQTSGLYKVVRRRSTIIASRTNESLHARMSSAMPAFDGNTVNLVSVAISRLFVPAPGSQYRCGLVSGSISANRDTFKTSRFLSVIRLPKISVGSMIRSSCLFPQHTTRIMMSAPHSAYVCSPLLARPCLSYDPAFSARGGAPNLWWIGAVVPIMPT